MAILEQDKLDADDCTEMIISMWFKLPEDLPGQENPTGDESIPEDATIHGFSHTYILMEWGGYEQAGWTEYYGVMPTVATSVSFDDTVPWLDPAQINWYSRPNDAPNFPNPLGETFYIWMPDTPFHPNDPFDALFPWPLEDPQVVVDSIKRAEWHATNPKKFIDGNPDNPDPGNEIAWNALGWGLKIPQDPLVTNPPPGMQIGKPGHSILGDVGAEVIVPTYVALGKYYNYFPPSSIYVNAFDDLDNITTTSGGYGVTVDIGGAIFGPLSADIPRAVAIGYLPSTFPGTTVVPRLVMTVPHNDPNNPVDDPHPAGSPEKPLATRDAWHHLLVCVKLADRNMCEEVPVEASPRESFARYLDNTMYVLLDGVPYGGKPWPPHIRLEDNSDGGNQLVESANQRGSGYFEGGEVEDINVRPPEFIALQNSTEGHGIAVKDLPFHIPYDKRWLRTDLDDWEWDKYPDFFGWRGGDTTLNVIRGGPTYGSQSRNDFYPVPAVQIPVVSEGPGDARTAPPQTKDIKRQYSDIQIWFGKYIDPTDPSNLRLFLEIERNTDGELVGNIPPLDEASLNAYHAAQADDPTLKILSLAAAPNHLGKPDIYLAGGAGPFIHDRGEEGDVLVKTGTIKSVPGPQDIPIPESAVKPPGV